MKNILYLLLPILIWNSCVNSKRQEIGRLQWSYTKTIENLAHYQTFQTRELDYRLRNEAKAKYRSTKVILDSILYEIQAAKSYFQKNWQEHPQISIEKINNTYKVCQLSYQKLLCDEGRILGIKSNEIEWRFDNWILENRMFPIKIDDYANSLDSARIQIEWAIYRQKITQQISELSSGILHWCFFNIPISNLPTQNVYQVNQPATLKFGIGYHSTNSDILDVSVTVNNVPVIQQFTDFYDTIHLSTTTDTTFLLDFHYNRIHPFTLELYPFHSQHAYDVISCAN